MNNPHKTRARVSRKSPSATLLADRIPPSSAQTANSENVAAKTSTPTYLARVPMSARWGDLDAFNHVNNAAFLVYIQEARLAWLARIEGTWFDESMMPVVAAVQMNYRRQLAWPSDIVVELATTRIGNSSLTVAHRIVAPDDAACVYADGEVVMVWIDPSNGRSVALPEAIRIACQSPDESAATTSK